MLLREDGDPVTEGVVPILFNALRNGRVFRILGDGSAERDYIEMDDLNAAVDRVVRVDMENRPTMIFNIGSGSGTSLNELISLLESITGKVLERTHEPTLHDVQSSVLNCRRAKNVLGWEAKTSLETGLRQFARRLKEMKRLT